MSLHLQMRWPLLILVILGAAATGAAVQQGHPLTGTWTGSWGPDATQRKHLTFVLSWDGDKVSGTINPGPDAIDLESVGVNLNNWTVRFEGETKDASGKAVRVSAEGRIVDLGSIHRTISGTWREGEVTGDFKITRN